MIYVYLTDNSAAANTMMTSLNPPATKIHTFANHTLWSYSGADPFSGKGVVPDSPIYVKLLLPNPL